MVRNRTGVNSVELQGCGARGKCPGLSWKEQEAQSRQRSEGLEPGAHAAVNAALSPPRPGTDVTA